MTNDLDLVGSVLRLFRIEVVPNLPPAQPVPADSGAVPIRVVDRRSVVRKVNLSSSKPRDVSKIPAVMLHQMGVELGLTKRQIAAAGGDVIEALIQRAMRQPYHVVGLLCGVVVINHDFALRTSHGDAGNDAVGVGIEGLFPMSPATREARHTSPARAVEVARVALREAVHILRQSGADDLELRAHRQYDAKPADPGGELWAQAGLVVAGELGLTVDYELAVMSGRPIPNTWDPAATHNETGAVLT